MKKNSTLLRGSILLVFCFLAVNVSFAQQWGRWCYKDYESSSSFTVPQGCTKVFFEAVGGGGAGGFIKSEGQGMIDELYMSKYYQVSAGGGGGAYGRSDTVFGLTPGETFAITVGLGGRNTAVGISHDEYIADCTISIWPEAACLLPSAWDNHNLYKKYWHGPWMGITGWNGIIPEISWSEWPFYKNRYHRDGGTSSVKRNNTNVMILEAYGGKSVSGDNSIVGAQGGGTGGAGAFHARGGNGGNAKRDCPNLIEEAFDAFTSNSMWGRISAGGGGAAGNPYGYSPDYRTEAFCDAEEGFGRGGTGYCYQMFGVGETTDGYGGEGTSDWAWDADAHNGRQGDNGKPKGGAGGGSKIGVAGWCAGGSGGDGFVRVWFYIDDRAMTVTPTATPSELTGSGQTTLNAGVSDNLVQSGFFTTQYSWNPSGKTTNPITETVSQTKQYCVNVTNICTYATNSDVCRATNNGCVTVTVNPVNPGVIAADNATWVCNPGDTVVTITSTTDATPNDGTYSWQYSSDNSSWTTIGDADGKEYTVENTTGYYRRGYTYGSNSTVYSNAVHVTRPSDIDPGMVKDDANNTTTSVCSGGDVSVNLTAGNTTYPVTWQTSTDRSHWDDVTSVTPLSVTGLTTTTYVRYVVNYTASCGVPSNNYYTLNVWENPVVNSIAAPDDKCPGKTSYTVTADVTEGSSSNLTYHWTDATGSSNEGTVAATLPNCNTPYSYSLYVTDDNNCTSNTETGNFTTENPAWSLGTIANVTATSGGSCDFSVPSSAILTAAVNAALSSSCGNQVTLSNINPTPGTPIASDQSVTATATDMCGVTHEVTIPVKKPDAPTVEVVPTVVADMFLCPGETTILTAIPDAEDPTYQWTPSSLGTGATATTIAYTGEDVVAHADNYSVVVTDKYGCTGTGNFTVYTMPKAYVADKEYTICSDNAATMSLATGDKVPAGNSTIDLFTFTYTTTYTWTISTPNANITGATEATTAQANFTTGNLYNATLEKQTIVYTVTPTTVTTVDGSEVTSCPGAPFTVTVKVRPKVTNDGAITNFDDADVIITLWYSACDTLYYVETPTYDNNILPADLFVTISNSASSSANAGTILGRIAPGEYTIVWTLTDQCGNSVPYTKKYIVRYPNCGDNDPNYTDPFYAEDANGIFYHTVRIGCECWTAENLRSTKYSDDTDIPSSNVYHSDDYPNDAENEAKFGRLYSWYSAMHVTEGDDTAEPSTSNSPVGRYVQGVCPAGWAVPTVGIYTSMKNISGAIENVKSSDQTTWLPGLAGIAPGSGFNAKGAGYYESYIDRYMNLLGQTDFWTSTIGPTVQKGTCVEITHVCPEMLIKDYMKGLGFSVRCVKRDYAPEPETFNCGTSKMIDAGGHEYETVQIGTQCWTKTNLHVAPAGAMDKTASSSIETSSTVPYYYVYPYVDASVYGYYYNWQAARLVCPTGWHLPSDAEWTMLTDYVGSQSEYVCGSPADPTYIAKALASKEDWESSTGSCTPGYNTNTNNKTGFSAIPADIYNGTAVARPALGYSTYFWSSTEDGSNSAFDRSLRSEKKYVNRFGENKENSMSVRCVKDSE